MTPLGLAACQWSFILLTTHLRFYWGKKKKQAGQPSCGEQLSADSRGCRRNRIMPAFLWSLSNCTAQDVGKQHWSGCLHVLARTGTAAVIFWHFWKKYSAAPHLSLVWLLLISSFHRCGEQSGCRGCKTPHTQHARYEATQTRPWPTFVCSIYLNSRPFRQTGVSSFCWKFSLCADHWHCLQKQLHRPAQPELQKQARVLLGWEPVCVDD